MAFSPLTILKLNRWRGDEPAVDPLAAQAKRDVFVAQLLDVSREQGLRAALDYYQEEVESERQEYAREDEIRNALRSIHSRGVDDLDAMIESLTVEGIKHGEQGKLIFQETLIQTRGLPSAHPAMTWVRMFVEHKPNVCADTFLSGYWCSLWIHGVSPRHEEKTLTRSMSPELIDLVRSCWEMAVDKYCPRNSRCGEDGIWRSVGGEVASQNNKRDPLSEAPLAGLVDVWHELQVVGLEPCINEVRLSKLDCAIQQHPILFYHSESQEFLDIMKNAIKRRKLDLVAQRHSVGVERHSLEAPSGKKMKL